MRYNEVKVTKGIRMSVAKSLRKTRKRIISDAVEESLQKVGFNDGRYSIEFLADLIEPEPERSCHMTYDETEHGYRCSKCLSISETVKRVDGKYYVPAYCSECGSKNKVMY